LRDQSVDRCSAAWRQSISCEQKYSTAHSSKLVCAIRQDNFVIALWVGSMWLAASSGCWPADHLDVLNHALQAE
jgi:hypothetical protein